MKIWRCRWCHGQVVKQYDHVGPRCTPFPETNQCSGTFYHKPARPLCTNRGVHRAKLELDHKDVYSLNYSDGIKFKP